MRIYTSNNIPLDFCDDCAPDETEALELYGNLGHGPDGRGNCFDYDADHPDYNHENYACVTCDLTLVDLSTSSWFSALGNSVPDGCTQASF